jgi:hypothetical protein
MPQRGTIRVLLAGCLLAGPVPPIVFCQAIGALQAAQPGAVEKELRAEFDTEERRGEYTFYTQSFVDKENQRVAYSGSVYEAIKDFAIDACSISIDTVLVDSFAGIVGKKQTGKLQDDSRSSICLLLTREIADRLAVVEARPVELAPATNSVCTERPSCTFTWLQIQTKLPVIRETKWTNHSLVFDGTVNHFLLPVSSAQRAKEIIERLQNFAYADCR